MTTEGSTGPTPEQRIAALEAEINKHKDAAQTWMGKYTDIEKKLGGKSPEALRAAAEERDILAAQQAGGDPKKIESEVERRANEIRQEFAPKLQEKDTAIQTMSARLKELEVVDSVVKEAGDKIYPKAQDDFRSYVRQHCDKDENGNLIVKDANGKTRYSPKDPSKLMTVGELITELQANRDHWFTNKTTSGGHDPARGGGAAGVTITSYADMLSVEKTHGIKIVAEQFQKLDEATKAKIRGEMRTAGVDV